MTKLYLPALAVCSVLLFGSNNHLSAQTTFSYTGSMQTYVVPSGVTLLTIDAAGGSGGDGYSSAGPGGKGGRVQCDLSVTPGQVLYMGVGGKGTNGGSGSTGVPGGYNGGGNSTGSYGAGGGGATDIRTGGTGLSSRAVVAGAGGGGGYNCSTGMDGGAGGGLVADTGWSCGSKHYSGMCYNPTGGTQTAGGMNGTCVGGSASAGVGANGYYYGGAGGAGYYGGGGAYYYSGGGGGSSYTDPTTTSSVVHTQGYNTGNGYITFTTSCPLPVISVITGTTIVSISGTSALSDATPSGVWSSSNTFIATVSSGGLLTGMAAGTATISYSVTNVCGTSSTTTSVIVTSGGGLQVANTSGADKVSVYPNPTSGTINIQWSNQPSGAGVIKITDMVGREVYRSSMAINAASGIIPVDLKTLINGVYLLSVKTDNINYSGKLLIQK